MDGLRQRARRMEVLEEAGRQQRLRRERGYAFSAGDWHERHVVTWLEHVAPLLRGRASAALEVGCFEGAATTFMLDALLEHEDARVEVVDTFAGSADATAAETTPQAAEAAARGGGAGALEAVFRANLAKTGAAHKCVVRRGDSAVVLRALPPAPAFDLVYVDGSHVARHVLADAVLAWPLLRPGGVLVFDDYLWDLEPDAVDRPRLAVDAFLACYAPELEVLHRDLQVIVRKGAKGG